MCQFEEALCPGNKIYAFVYLTILFSLLIHR